MENILSHRETFLSRVRGIKCATNLFFKRGSKIEAIQEVELIILKSLNFMMFLIREGRKWEIRGNVTGRKFEDRSRLEGG